MGRPKGVYPPTEKEMKECFGYLSREYSDLTERQKYIAREVMTKAINYDPDVLSDTAKNEICEIYAYEQYGKYSLSAGGKMPLTMDKGTIAEDESIKLLSKIDGIEYSKNKRVIANRYFKGIPDILVGQYRKYITGVKDVKTVFDLPEFLSLVDAPPRKNDVWQMMGYLDILGIESGEVCYCLVNMPESMMIQEEERLRAKYTALDIEEAQIQRKLAAVKFSMVYDDIPEQMRVVRHTIQRDSIKLREAHSRVTLARKWLKDLDGKFNDLLTFNQNKQSISNQESTN